MATMEERLAFIEQEHAELKNTNTELKKTVELQTIAIGALVNKAMLERLNEKNDKLFDALIAHDSFTNTQLHEVRDYLSDLDGKIVGVQTEVRQRFEQQEAVINNRFEQQDQRMTELRADVTSQGQKIDQILLLLTNKPEQNT